jgi:uncharacterized membrane-anchored protein
MADDKRTLAEQAVSKVPEVIFGFWIIKIAATTLGETGGDWVTMSLSLGYLIGTGIFAIIFIGLVAAQVNAGKFHPFLYWTTIVATTTLGTTIADFADRSLDTALGDWVAGSSDRGGLGLGYEYGAVIFGVGLAVVAALYFWTKISHTLLFWAAFILTRPLGATLGDLLDKPVVNGGLHLSRLYASLILLAFIVRSVLLIPQRAAKHNAAA